MRRARSVIFRGAAICWGGQWKYWNSNVVKLFEASTLTTKKYEPALDSVSEDTSFELMGL